MFLSTWIHPTTNQMRIYVNDEVLGRGEKVFFVESDAVAGMADFVVKGGKRAYELAETVGQQFLGDWEKMVAAAKP